MNKAESSQDEVLAEARPVAKWRSGPLMSVAICASLLLGAVLLYVTYLHDVPDPASPFRAYWWVLVIVLMVTDNINVRVGTRAGSDRFSFATTAVVFGMFFASTEGLVIATPLATIASAAVGKIWARKNNTLLSTAFNTTMWAFSTAVGLSLFHVLVGAAPHGGKPLHWAVAIAVSVFSGFMVEKACVVAALWLLNNERTPYWRTLGFVYETAVSGVAVAACVMIWAEPISVWLALLMLGAVTLGIHGYTRLDNHNANLERLYDFTGSINQALDRTSTEEAMLSTVQRMLRAETSMMHLAASSDGPPLILRAHTGGHVERLEPFQRNPVSFIETDTVRLIVEPQARGTDLEFLKRYGFTQMMVAPLNVGEETIGTLVVADRPYGDTSYDEDDVRLFSMMAIQASMALDNARLFDRVMQQALYDSLTSIPNRALFQSRLEDAMVAARETGESFGVLLIDLNDFKGINDTYGHHVGDEVLVAAAQRLSTVVRPFDTVARLGGDEFAVLIRGANDELCERISGRIVEVLATPVALEDLVLQISGSVGVSLFPRDGDDIVTILSKADTAMYGAKQSGGGFRQYGN